MDFLKKLFEESETGLTYDALEEKVKAAGMNLVDLSGGGYVAKGKFDAKADELKKVNEQLAARDNDLKALNEKLTAAQTDAGKLKEAQDALTAAQAQYAADRQQWEADTAKRAYESAVRLASAGLKFSSGAARRAFEADAIAKGLPMEGDKVLGLDDYVKSYRESDPGAFAVETPPATANPTPPPTIVAGTNAGNGTPGAAQGFHFNFTGVRPKPSE